MKNWKSIVLVLGSAAVLVAAGAGGRAASWTTSEGDDLLEAVQPTDAPVSDGQPTADANGTNGAAPRYSR